MRKSLGVRGKLVLGSSVTVAALSASVALAATVDLDDTRIQGGGRTTWNTGAAQQVYCVPFTPSGTSLAYDGKAADRHDGPDGALLLVDGGDPFLDPDGMGEKQGQTVSAGPEQHGNLHISAEGTAIKDAPALRMVYALKNSGGSKI